MFGGGGAEREVSFHFGGNDRVCVREQLHVPKKAEKTGGGGVEAKSDPTSQLYHYSGCAVYEAAVVMARFLLTASLMWRTRERG
jgi:hypothetical protein